VEVGQVGVVVPLAAGQLVGGHWVDCVAGEGVVAELLYEESAVAVLVHSMPLLFALKVGYELLQLGLVVFRTLFEYL
jgi:hypothetical protein